MHRHIHAILLLIMLVIESTAVLAQQGYQDCIDLRNARLENPGINEAPHLKPIPPQTVQAGKLVRLRLQWCDPENQAPGTIAFNMPDGAALPDNGDGTRSFVWIPQQSGAASVIFTVYEETDTRIRTSITVPISVVDAPASAPQHAITVSAQIPTQSSTDTRDFRVEGRIIAPTGLSLPQRVNYSASDLTGQVYTEGSLPVAANGQWQGTVQLLPGANRIQLESDGAERSVSLSVHYNPGYAFGGLLDLQPDVAYVYEPRLFSVRVALDDIRSKDSTVELIDAETELVITRLRDDGNLANGDEIEADSIYSGLFKLNAIRQGLIHYKVRVTLPDTQQAYSETAQLLVTERLDQEELSRIIAQQAAYEAQLAQAAPNERNMLLRSIQREMARDPMIADAGTTVGSSGVWLVYNNGIAGAVYAPAAGTKGAGATVAGVSSHASIAVDSSPAPYSKYCPQPNTGATTLLSDNAGLIQSSSVSSSKVLAIAAQFWDWGNADDIPRMQQTLSDHGCYDVTYRRYLAKGDGSVEDFKNLGDYGTILISSHGDSFYSGIDSQWQQRFGWNGTGGQVVVDSNMAATPENRIRYEDDLHTGRLVLWGTNLAITPGFVEKYSGVLPNSLVYMSICRGTWNASMASAFINNGAGSFLGYDNYVSVAFCLEMGPTLLDSLLQDDKSLSEAFFPGQLDPYASDVVEFELFGNTDLELQAGDLRDGSFEHGSLSQAWQVNGDARLVSSLGEYDPTDGDSMAILSTGLGYTRTSGSIVQPVCLCEDTTTVSFDWNLFSEEFLEYVGSQFQDDFTVSLVDLDNSQNRFILFNETIDSLAASVQSVNHSFDQDDVYATGWRSFAGKIPGSFSGQSVSLQFSVSDAGDSIFDTAVLLDDIQIRCTSNTATAMQ
ncbi:MAG: hypothetical protein AB8B63_06330 [Granulosicoccus sp.]